MSNAKQFEGFFTDLKNTTPFFKCAAQGGAGSGKTFTSALIAAGLHQRIQSTRPIIIYDTERSSKFLRPMFQNLGIQVLVRESRSLTDLMATFDYCEDGGADILMIDSITHVYEDFLEAYKRKMGRKTFQFQDWGIIKPEWKRNFSDRLVMARFHVLFTGRQGYTYDYEDNGRGKKELVKTGVRMKAEAETAYEPDVLLMMDRFEDVLGDSPRVWRTATVLKDRSQIIDGQVIENPTFDHFAPILDFLLSDPADPTDIEAHTDDDLFEPEEDNRESSVRRRTLWERIQAELDTVAAGTSGDAKQMRLALLKRAFMGETSETAIKELNIEAQEECYALLCEWVKVIDWVVKKEVTVYGAKKAIDDARSEHLGTVTLADMDITLDGLKEYAKHIKGVLDGQKTT